MRKPKILIVSDSAAIHTGFATVARNIGLGLYESGRYEVSSIGWFHDMPGHTMPFDIIPTRMETKAIAEVDKYAEQTFPAVAAAMRPDVVVAIGDPWMIKPVLDLSKAFGQSTVAYVPVDGLPFSKKFAYIGRADRIVAYGDFGEKAMVSAFPLLKGRVDKIPHGVDLDVFKPMPPDKELEAFSSLLRNKHKFLVGTVARNQPRKNLPAMLKMFRLFLSGYLNCAKCGALYFEPLANCGACGHSEFNRGQPKDDAAFYFHGALKEETGWDFMELVSRLGLTGKVGYPKGMDIGRGVEESVLAMVYNSMDVFTLPTLGEGWGLPILEAMACGKPCLVTGYSGHLDFCDGFSELIRVGEFETEPISNIERACVDIYDYTMRLDRLYYNDIETFQGKWRNYLEVNGVKNELVRPGGDTWRTALGMLAANKASEFAWPGIVESWMKLIDEVVASNGLNAGNPLEGICFRAI